MHLSQPSLGNDFTLFPLQARDSKAWQSPYPPQPQPVRSAIQHTGSASSATRSGVSRWRSTTSSGSSEEDQRSPYDRRHPGHAHAGCPALSAQQRSKSSPSSTRSGVTGSRARPGGRVTSPSLVKAGGGFAVPHTMRTRCSTSRTKRASSSPWGPLHAAAAGRLHISQVPVLRVRGASRARCRATSASNGPSRGDGRAQRQGQRVLVPLLGNRRWRVRPQAARLTARCRPGPAISEARRSSGASDGEGPRTKNYQQNRGQNWR